MDQYNILDKYCSVVLNSNIENAVTFDIPNLFKVRTQAGNVSRNLFSEPGCRELLITASAKYANYTYRNVNKESQFQFFNLTQVWDLINFSLENDISILNVTSEPVVAQEIASLFNVILGTIPPRITYDMRSIYAKDFKGKNGYMYSKENIIEQIIYLKENFSNL